MKVQHATIPLTLSLLSLGGGSAHADVPEVALVREGRAAAVLVLDAESHVTSRAAAGELVKHVALMTGVELPVVAQDAGGGSPRPVRIRRARFEEVTMVQGDAEEFRAVAVVPSAPSGPSESLLPIRLGEAAGATLEALLEESGGGSNTFALRVDDTGIWIRGRQPVGTQHGGLRTAGATGGALV